MLRKPVLIFLYLLSFPLFAQGLLCGPVNQAAEESLSFLAADQAAHPSDRVRFQTLFQRLSGPLTDAIGRIHLLGGDDAMEVVQEIFNSVWTGRACFPGDASWDELRTLRWFRALAPKHIKTMYEGRRGQSVHTVNPHLVKKKNEPDDEPSYEANPIEGLPLPADLTVTQAMIEKLPHVLHRFVLMRNMQGRSVEQIGEEIGRSGKTVNSILNEARYSLSEVLKGRWPVESSRHCDPEVMERLERILEAELDPRPIRAPEEEVAVEESQFFAFLEGEMDITLAVARLFFVEGKRIPVIMDELGIEYRQVSDAVQRTVKVVTAALGRDPVPAERLWIIDENGNPSAHFRQADYAVPPQDPEHVTVDELNEALKAFSWRDQQIAKMRFAEGLSREYIVAVTGLTNEVVKTVIRKTVQTLAQRTGREITALNLAIVGDIGEIHVSPVSLPAKLYLEKLALRGEGGDDAKLAVAKQMSGLNVRSVGRIVLVNEKNKPIVSEDYPRFFESEPSETEAPVLVNLPTFHVVLSRLSPNDAQILDLYLRQRWSYPTLIYYFGFTRADLKASLNRGAKTLGKEMGDRDRALGSYRIGDSGRARARTIQVDGEEFRLRVLALSDTSMASVNQMVSDWKRRAVSEDQPLELVDKSGKPLFDGNHDFVARPPVGEVEKLKLEDFEEVLTTAGLSENDLRVLRLRFRDGWGSTGIRYLWTFSEDQVAGAILRGMYALNGRLDKKVSAEGLQVITFGRATVKLAIHAVNIDALTGQLRPRGNYSPRTVLAAARRISGKKDLQLEQTVLIGSRGHALHRKEVKLVLTPSEDPQILSYEEMIKHVPTTEQREALRMRYEYRWSPFFIAQLWGMEDAEVGRRLAAGLQNLRKGRPEIVGSRLVLLAPQG